MVAVASADVENTSFNGRPGCKDITEVGLTYANFFDSSRYWLCISQGTQAISKRCPNQFGYQPSIRACVSYKVWKWEEPVMPITCPDFEQECIPSGVQQASVVPNNLMNSPA